MILNTYVNFAGRCAEAFGFYAEHLGATVTAMTLHRDVPNPNLPPGWGKAVLHGRLQIGGTDLMAADIPDAQPMRSAYLTLRLDTDAESERIYSALSEGGKIFMAMNETFFASRFAQLQDQFGINWMIMTERATG
ncbi:MAG: VOC family protein [Gemmatimonadaceae bacterium]